MGFRGNRQLPNNHFRKDWQRRVRTWFDQPARKTRRRLARTKKAAALAPRPISALRPAIRCPGARYNSKLREGRGFTFEELKKAGFEIKKAKGLGIAVDFRRRNTNEETLQRNVERLTTYKSRLIIFPKKTGVIKKGDAGPEVTKTTQFHSVTEPVLPVTTPLSDSTPRPVDPAAREKSQYVTLRKAMSDAKLIGKREKRAKAKLEEEAAKGKK